MSRRSKKKKRKEEESEAVSQLRNWLSLLSGYGAANPVDAVARAEFFFKLVEEEVKKPVEVPPPPRGEHSGRVFVSISDALYTYEGSLRVLYTMQPNRKAADTLQQIQTTLAPVITLGAIANFVSGALSGKAGVVPGTPPTQPPPSPPPEIPKIPIPELPRLPFPLPMPIAASFEAVDSETVSLLTPPQGSTKEETEFWNEVAAQWCTDLINKIRQYMEINRPPKIKSIRIVRYVLEGPERSSVCCIESYKMYVIVRVSFIIDEKEQLEYEHNFKMWCSSTVEIWDPHGQRKLTYDARSPQRARDLADNGLTYHFDEPGRWRIFWTVLYPGRHQESPAITVTSSVTRPEDVKRRLHKLKLIVVPLKVEGYYEAIRYALAYVDKPRELVAKGYNPFENPEPEVDRTGVWYIDLSGRTDISGFCIPIKSIEIQVPSGKHSFGIYRDSGPLAFVLLREDRNCKVHDFNGCVTGKYIYFEFDPDACYELTDYDRKILQLEGKCIRPPLVWYSCEENLDLIIQELTPTPTPKPRPKPKPKPAPPPGPPPSPPPSPGPPPSPPPSPPHHEEHRPSPPPHHVELAPPPPPPPKPGPPPSPPARHEERKPEEEKKKEKKREEEEKREETVPGPGYMPPWIREFGGPVPW